MRSKKSKELDNRIEYMAMSKPEDTIDQLGKSQEMSQEKMKVVIEKLQRERNEARRLHCHMSAQFLYKSVALETAKHVATNMGWDCFENNSQ